MSDHDKIVLCHTFTQAHVSEGRLYVESDFTGEDTTTSP